MHLGHVKLVPTLEQAGQTAPNGVCTAGVGMCGHMVPEQINGPIELQAEHWTYSMVPPGRDTPTPVTRRERSDASLT